MIDGIEGKGRGRSTRVGPEAAHRSCYVPSAGVLAVVAGDAEATDACRPGVATSNQLGGP